MKCSRFITLIFLLLIGLVPLAPTAAQSSTPLQFTRQDDPVLLLNAYYNAIARGEYDRAYNYWSSATGNMTRQQFAAGFAETAQFEVFVRLPVRVGVAAGTSYAEIATLLQAVKHDGTSQTFIGCFVAKHSNVPVGNNPQPDPNWSIHSANLTEDSTAILTDLNTACEQNIGVNMEGYAQEYRAAAPDALVAYFNAVVRREYGRAYGYWLTPPGNATLQQFSAGYANTADVWVYVKLNITETGDVVMLPTFLAGIQPSGVGEYFAGCYTLRAFYDVPSNTNLWWLERGRIAAVPNLITGMARMQCP